MPFRIIRADITTVRADAIVNTANPEPVYASGTDSAIYKAAGAEQLLKERRKIGCIQVGEAAVTKAFALPARYIIHTVGPAWRDGEYGEFEQLASCYRKSLLLAEQLECRSIAFPLISTGVYGFPKDRALAVALEMIADFLEESESDMEVILTVFDKTAFDLSALLVADVQEFIDENYVSEKSYEEYAPPEMDMPLLSSSRPDSLPKEEARSSEKQDRLKFWRRKPRRRESSSELSQVPREPDYMMELSLRESSPAANDLNDEAEESSSFQTFGKLEDVMRHMGETFQERLFRLIDERGLTDTEVYKKANIDRKLFSKIRCNSQYIPQKRTAVAFAIALRLNLDETMDLLRRAGLALSPSSKFDLIVEYCIRRKIYDLYEINALLFEYDQPMIGC